jgi:pimeloyl-ACP methyl ester carboxylesterase
MTNVGRTTLTLDVSSVAPTGCASLCGDFFQADQPLDRPLLWVCVPGGGINREYFDLAVPGAGDTYSMARCLARRDIVLTIDPPGVGESDVPDDPYLLSPEVVADVLAAALTSALALLGELPGVRGKFAPRAIIGLGHSAGALLVAYQQARHESFAALALLGFSASGLPGVLNEEESRHAGHPEEFAKARVELTRARFGDPLPAWSNSSGSEPDAVARSSEIDVALKRATSRLLALVGMTAITPGAVQPQLDQIVTPLFTALGEQDLAGTLDTVPAQYPSCKDLTLFQLERSGHSHNIAPTREVLWERLLRWGASVT